MAENKAEGKEERIKAFVSVRKHWSETLHDPSAELQTPLGTIFVYLHRISNANYDGFRPNISPFFPYGLNAISTGGSLPGMHLYFTAIMPEKVADQHKRKHYLLVLYLPRIRTPFVGGDTFHCSLGDRTFEEFYLETPLKKKESKQSVKFADQLYQVFQAPHVGRGGLITIPDDLRLTRAIEVSIREISQEEWKKGPWSFREEVREMEMGLRKDIEALQRRNAPRPGWRDRLIGSRV